MNDFFLQPTHTQFWKFFHPAIFINCTLYTYTVYISARCIYMKQFAAVLKNGFIIISFILSHASMNFVHWYATMHPFTLLLYKFVCMRFGLDSFLHTYTVHNIHSEFFHVFMLLVQQQQQQQNTNCEVVFNQ